MKKDMTCLYSHYIGPAQYGITKERRMKNTVSMAKKKQQSDSISMQNVL